MKRYVAILARLLTAVCLTTLLAAPAARSQPAEGAAAAAAPVIPLSQLGGLDNLAFYGVQGTQQLAIPVPQGLTPVSLNAITQLPVNVRTATVTVAQDDRQIARVDIPPGDGGPVVVPLAGVQVVNNAVNLTVRTYLLPVDGYCLDPTNPLRFSTATVSFAGTDQAPTSVADFLPSVLRQLTIYVDDRPTTAVADAAIRLATAVAAGYGAQLPDISVVALAPGQTVPSDPSAPFSRHFVIRESNDTGVSLIDANGTPALLIAGPAQDLANQSRLVTSNIARLALTTKAVVGPLSTTAELPGDEVTLSQLGQTGISNTGLSPQVNVGLDQTRLGRSAHDMRVHLRGSYTPLPQDLGAQLVASIGGQTVDRWAVDNSGAIDHVINVPDQMLTRSTDVVLNLDMTGNTGRCEEFEPPTLTIDGDSTVSSTVANPPVPGGFQSMPQSLMPHTVVGLGDGFDDLRRAIDIMVGLQRLSALPMDTTVKSVEDAVADTAPAVIIIPAGWTDDRIKLPIGAANGGQLTVARADAPGETTTLTVDPTLAFGSLQTVRAGDRSVLVATSNNAPDQLDALLNWLGGDATRWQRANGTALIAAAGREPLVFNTMPAPEPTEVQPVAQVAGLPWWVWAAVAAAAALIVLAVVVIVLRSKRTQAPDIERV